MTVQPFKKISRFLFLLFSFYAARWRKHNLEFSNDISNSWHFYHFASMADRKHTREVFTVLILCVLWYAVSSSNNVIGKMVLSEFPYPITMTMVQLLSVTVFSGPFFNLFGVRKYVDISWKYYFRLIVPLAFGKFFASVFSHVSIWKVPVSYAHTGMFFEVMPLSLYTYETYVILKGLLYLPGQIIN